MAGEELQSVEARLQSLSAERDKLASEKNELQEMVAKLSGKLEDMVTESAKRQAMDAHAATVMARLQEKNKEYREENQLMEKELANIEEEKVVDPKPYTVNVYPKVRCKREP